MSVVKYISILRFVASTTSDIILLPIDLRRLIAQFCTVPRVNVSLSEVASYEFPLYGFYTHSDGYDVYFAIPRFTSRISMVDMQICEAGQDVSDCRIFERHRCELSAYIRIAIKTGFGVITIISDSSPLIDGRSNPPVIFC